jgi:hypothetical protein
MLARLYRVVMRQALQRGVYRGSQVWLGVGVAALAYRVVQRVVNPRRPVVRHDLQPGEALIISRLPDPS